MLLGNIRLSEMKTTFTYFDPQNLISPLDSYCLALSAIKRDQLIIDSDYLPVLEAAQRGHIPAICEMASLFGSGARGLPKNYFRAKLYLEVLKEHNEGHPKPEIEALYGLGHLEFDYDNFEMAKSAFIQAAKIMVNNLNPEDWNFNVFYYLQRLASQENEEGEIK